MNKVGNYGNNSEEKLLSSDLESAAYAEKVAGAYSYTWPNGQDFFNGVRDDTDDTALPDTSQVGVTGYSDEAK